MSIVTKYSYSEESPSAYKFDLVNFITRAQILHLQHERSISRALEISQRVVVIVGSAGKARDTRNPFTFEERKKMIMDTFDNNPRLFVEPLRDYPYNNTMWASYVQKIIAKHTEGVEDARIGLIGHRKEDTNYYIDMFPQWEFIEIGQTTNICASDLRNVLFDSNNNRDLVRAKLSLHVSPVIAHQVLQFAYSWNDSAKVYETRHEMKRLQREASFLKKHAKSWESAPYAPTFVTVDAVVVQSGHVLVIRRRSAPGENLLALPGGYLDPGERIADAMVRELYEETKLKVPKEVIRGSIQGTEVYDYPSRSLRGRIITHASLVKLRAGELATVKGASDAKIAFWLPISEFYTMQDEFFEDHWYIIEDMIQRFVK